MKNAHRLEVSIELDSLAWARIKPGWIPQSMDEKWFVFYEEGYLFFHRSWTGYEIFSARIEFPSQDKIRIAEIWVERDQERYSSVNDESCISTFQSLIKYLSTRKIRNLFKDGIFGLIVGDAIGVPVEFMSREQLQMNPVQSMIGYGTHQQPPGTWSDDSSLALCLASSLVNGYDLHDIGRSCLKWYEENYWTPYGHVFDIGLATRESLERLKKLHNPELAGGLDEHSNGNGSLMRILPLLCLLQDIPDREKRYQIVKAVSSITHAHVRSCLACFYYLEFASYLSNDVGFFGPSLKEAYNAANHSFTELVNQLNINLEEVKKFNRLTDGQIAMIPEYDIQSSGYVIHTLEASVWCLLTTSSYAEAVLKAVNLGIDTDTTGAVTGGLAGLLYGYDNIPYDWRNQIARKADILELFEKLSIKYEFAWI